MNILGLIFNLYYFVKGLLRLNMGGVKTSSANNTLKFRYFLFYYLLLWTSAETEALPFASVILIIACLPLAQYLHLVKFTKSFQCWLVLLVIWYMLNSFRSDVFVYAINQIIKLVLPLIVFSCAYIYCTSRGRIVSFSDKMSNTIYFFAFLNLLSVVIATPLSYDYYGLYILVFPLIMYCQTRKKKYLFLILLCFSSFLVYVKRTVLVCLFAMLGLYCIYRYKSKAVLPIFLIIVSFICAILFVPAIKERFFFVDFDAEDGLELLTSSDIFMLVNSNGRSEFWEDLLKIMYKGNELFGVGTGNVKAWISSSKNHNTSFLRVHNDWLQVLCESGWTGISFLILYFCGIIHKTYKKFSVSHGMTKLVTMCLAMSTLTTAIHMFFENCMGCIGFIMPALLTAFYFRSLEFDRYEK